MKNPEPSRSWRSSVRMPQLFSRKCDTCVFHPGNRMDLQPGRLQNLIESNRREGTMLICHKTIDYGDHPEVGQTMCRGYFDAYAAESQVVQIMERICGPQWYVEVDPPTHSGDSTT